MFCNVPCHSVRDRPTRRYRAASCLAVAAVFTAAAALSYAQHSARPVNNGEGLRLYKANCILCHGLLGNSVAGVDLRRGNFRHAAIDEDVVRVIREGIPGTAMPSNNLSAEQAADIVSYLRSPEGIAAGVSSPEDVARGRAIFEGKGECLSCHRANGKGVDMGPNLDEIGGIRTPAELEAALLEPNAEVSPEFRLFRGVTRNGVSISGKPVNEDTFSVQILDSKGRLASIVKSSLMKFSFVNNSPMPSYRDKLNARELADLVAYLGTLTGL